MSLSFFLKFDQSVINCDELMIDYEISDQINNIM